MTKHMKKPLGSPPSHDEVDEAPVSTETESPEGAQSSQPKRWFFIPAPPVPGRTSWCLNEK